MDPFFLRLRTFDQKSISSYQAGRGIAVGTQLAVDGKLGSQGGAAPGREGRNMDHFCLRLRTFDEKSISSYLAERGIAVGEVASRYGAEGRGPSIYLSDPEGNTVELKGPPA